MVAFELVKSASGPFSSRRFVDGHADLCHHPKAPFHTRTLMIIAYTLFRSLSRRRRSHWYIWVQRQSAHYSLRVIPLHLQAEVSNLKSSYLDGQAINTAGAREHTSAISHLHSHEYTSEPVAFARIPEVQASRRGLSHGAMRYLVTRQQTRTYNADPIVTGDLSSYTKPFLADYSITIKQWSTNGFVSSFSL